MSPLPTSGELAEGRHLYPVRVYWEDTDAGGIVYHAAYLRFAERARSELLRVLGIDQTDMLAESGTGFAVTRLAIDYRRPARLDDPLVIETRVVDLGRATLTLSQEVSKAAESEGGRHILATLSVKLACVALAGEAAGRPRRLPAAVVAAFATVETGA